MVAALGAAAARPLHHAYCHGFLSTPASSKGRALEKEFRACGSRLELLDLNGPDGPSGLTHAGALRAIDECWQAAQRARPGTRLGLIGSSFGGWAAAAYAAAEPSRVDRLLLLCPGFDLGSRWERIVGGSDAVSRWREGGARTFRMPSDGSEVRIPWGFAAESIRRHEHDPALAPRVPTWILHGRDDQTVPVELSHQFAARAPELVRVRTLDDDHALTSPASIRELLETARHVFELAR